MVLQCIAVALIMIFPQIATFLPELMRTEATTQQTEPVDDSASRLEEDPLKTMQEESGPSQEER
jgi:hypothetical protein